MVPTWFSCVQVQMSPPEVEGAKTTEINGSQGAER